MALLNIKPVILPKDATHIGGHGRLIKDLGEMHPCNPNRPHQKNEPTEIYYLWSMGEWVIQFGRHLGKPLNINLITGGSDV